MSLIHLAHRLYSSMWSNMWSPNFIGLITLGLHHLHFRKRISDLEATIAGLRAKPQGGEPR